MSGPSKVSGIAMGDEDVKNIFYINLNPTFKNDEQNKLLSKMNDFVRLTTDWVAVQTGIAAQGKMKTKDLPSDDPIASQVARGNYRNKVHSVLMNTRANWLTQLAVDSIRRDITCKREELHFQLLSLVLPGSEAKKAVKKEYESVLSTISNSIDVTLIDTDTDVLRISFWVLIAVYKWEASLKKLQPTIRLASFATNDDLIKVVQSKRNAKDPKNAKDAKGFKDTKDSKDPKATITVKFEAQITDYVFNIDQFEHGPLEAIKQYLADNNILVKNSPIHIPVDA